MMNVEQARFNMIEQQVRPWEVLDAAVLALLATVKREDFVPPAYRSLAFMDLEVPLGDGQVMLAPRVQARLVQELAPHRHERVLHVGTGSGFVAALLGHRAQDVVTMEIRPALAETAQRNLRRAGLHNVRVRVGDGSEGCPDEGPFDAILLDGAVAQVPQLLLGQLKPGGRLVAIEGTEPVMRATRTRLAPQAGREELFDTMALPLDGFAPPTAFRF